MGERGKGTPQGAMASGPLQALNKLGVSGFYVLRGSSTNVDGPQIVQVIWKFSLDVVEIRVAEPFPRYLLSR